MTVGRLAPTPSGELHLGNALAFGVAWLSARAGGGELLLRIEDVDHPRARRDTESHLREDLLWLGLDWDRETPRQRTRDYSDELARLDTYFCRCTRAEIAALGGVHPRACRDTGHADGTVRWRLPDGEVHIDDRRWGAVIVDAAREFGDPVLRRRDGVWTYPMAVVADDVRDGVTEVVRGSDLLRYTALQIPLWRALGHAPPTWLHTPLLLGPDGAKLSKSHGSAGIRVLRERGATADDVWRHVLPYVGLPATSLQDAVGGFAPDRGSTGARVVDPESPLG